MPFSVATLKKSKTLDGPLKKPQKTPGQIFTHFAEKSNFSWKKSNFFFFAKISDDLFFNRPETEKTTTGSSLFHQKPLAFHQKTLQNMYFSGKSEKTQKNPRFFLNPQEKP